MLKKIVCLIGFTLCFVFFLCKFLQAPIAKPQVPYDPVRQSSFPYFTGDTWRFFCDWRLTDKETFDPKLIRRGDIIFVEFQMLRAFRKLARKIKYPVIVITSNIEGHSDAPLPGHHASVLKNPYIAGWFVQNIDCAPNDRVFPLPIGLSNTFWQRAELKSVKEKPRDILCYVNFCIGNNVQQRQLCFDHFAEKSWAEKIAGRSYPDYLEDLSRSVFVISPPGNGLDCHRTWEALYLKCYPVVLSSTLDPLYEGLPVVIVNSWDEVTEEFLKKKKEELDAQEWHFERAYFPHWLDKVQAFQKQLKNQSPPLLERIRSFLSI